MKRTSETIAALAASLQGWAAPAPSGDQPHPRADRRVLPPAAHVTRGLFWVLLVLLASQVAVALLADPALAQGVSGGNADNILTTGENIFDWLTKAVAICCGIGFLICFTLACIGSSNERLQARYKQGAAGCAVACLAAFLVPDIIALLEQVSGAQGG